VLGLLLIAAHPGTARSGTYAGFSDRQTLQFQISGGSGTSPQ
jgi:hypothetical protein